MFDFLPALLLEDAVRAKFSAPERTAEVWACMHLGICLAVTDMAATGAGAETSDDEIGTVGTRSSSSIRSRSSEKEHQTIFACASVFISLALAKNRHDFRVNSGENSRPCSQLLTLSALRLSRGEGRKALSSSAFFDFQSKLPFSKQQMRPRISYP
ncbi:hypothetical protein [Oligosphaera ethanolica]|uniref:Uncharacterized protein n=1 Tax=Oligosphaera ethanolica TaxID=760260 RepID=A0AAE3VDZ8_9BACT|nr:hypothetical protein [Oligosphaera ethanolica]MDQ0288676.1 hypothetical protein [Oligosphaera ethanolica]